MATKQIPDMRPVEAVPALIEDGYIIDEETGEILGLEQPVDTAAEDQAAEGILRRIGRAEARAAAAERQRAMANAELEAIELRALEEARASAEYLEHAAVAENCARIVQRETRKHSWLIQAFAGFLTGFAHARLRSKERSLATPFGTIRLRRNPARLVVADEAAAVDWLQGHGAQEAVRRTVLVSKIPSDLRESLLASPALGFVVEPERETLTVETGVPRC